MDEREDQRLFYEYLGKAYKAFLDGNDEQESQVRPLNTLSFSQMTEGREFLRLEVESLCLLVVCRAAGCRAGVDLR